MGKFQVCAGGRLALYAGVQDRGAGAEFSHSRYPDRTDAADGRRRTAADGKAGAVDYARGAFRFNFPQDGLFVFGVYAAGSYSWWGHGGAGRGAGTVRAQSGDGVSDCG